MVVFRNVLRIYSYIFESILCLMAIAVAAVTYLSGNEQLQLAWLPFEAVRLPGWLLIWGLLGLICVFLAGAGRRWLLLLFSAAVCVVLARGFFWGGYTFADTGDFRRATLLLGGAVLAALGAWPISSDRDSRVRRFR